MYDVVIVGGGIVGVSTAYELLQQKPHLSIAVIEKEDSFATHQTGRNSGVIHAGIYYEPGSLKAEFCRQGVKETVDFCSEHNIPFEQCGKLIVSTDESEKQRLQKLYTRASSNNVPVSWIDKDKLLEIEPNITGNSAILSRSTGIVNYKQIVDKKVELLETKEVSFYRSSQVLDVTEFSDHLVVHSSAGDLKCKFLIGCAGLYADKLAKMLDIDLDFKIIPFRGEYFKLEGYSSNFINHLIYPVPDPTLPFLGIHLTKMINGDITVGPNAILALAREGYKKTDVNLRELSETLLYPGFYKVLSSFMKAGVKELVNSFSTSSYLKEVNKYCPSVNLKDLACYPAGVRAQAVTKDGKLLHDFKFAKHKRGLFVCNAPSPAATSSIPIAKHICNELPDL